MRIRKALITAAVLAATFAHSQAATVAKWGFESGLSGTPGDDTLLQDNVALDDIANYTIVNGNEATSVHYSNSTADGEGLSLSSPGDGNYYGRITNSVARGFGPEEFTIEAWVRSDDPTGGWQTFLGKAGSTEADDDGADFYFQKADDGDQFRFNFMTQGSAERIVLDAGFTPDANWWYGCALVGDGVNAYMYVNEMDGNGWQLVDEAPLPGTNGLDSAADNALRSTPNIDWNVLTGWYDGNNADWADGAIDNIRFSDTALSTNEFQEFPLEYMFPPATPTWRAAHANGTVAKLYWNELDLASGYVISRSLVPSNFVVVAETTGSPYVETNSIVGTNYYYTIASKNQYGTSDPSEVRSITTQNYTIIGSSDSSYDDNPAAYKEAVFDGDTATFFDADDAVAWVGMDLGQGNAMEVPAVDFHPRAAFLDRAVGGLFQGSNDQVIWDTLYEITVEPDNEWQRYYTTNSATAYRYIRFYTADGHANVSEFMPVEDQAVLFDPIVSPARNSTDLNNPITISVTVPHGLAGVNPDSVEFLLIGEDDVENDVTAGSVTYVVGSKTVIQYTAGVLTGGEEYTVIVRYGDDGGRGFEAEVEWDFTVAPSFDIVSTSPTGAGQTNTVTLEAEVLDGDSIITGAVFYLDEVLLTGTEFVKDGETNIVTCELDDLLPSSSHSVTLELLTDEPALTINNTETWDFTMAEAFDISYSPEGRIPYLDPVIEVDVFPLLDSISSVKLFFDETDVTDDSSITLIGENFDGTRITFTPEELEEGATHHLTVVVNGEIVGEITRNWDIVLPVYGTPGIFIWTDENPPTNSLSIYNFVGSETDDENVEEGDDYYTYVAHDRGTQGQTFTTGSDEDRYLLKSVWVRAPSYGAGNALNSGDVQTIRIIDATMTNSEDFVVYQEELAVSPFGSLAALGNNTGRWIQYVLSNPVILDGDKQYGYDLTVLPDNTGMYYDTAGMISNLYDGGFAYTQGDENEQLLNEFGNVTDGDRTFCIPLEAVVSIPDVSVESAAPKGFLVEPDQTLEIVVKDWGVEVDPEDLTLILDGEAVAPAATKDGDVTTITFEKTDLTSGKHKVDLIVNGGAGDVNSWTFTVLAKAVEAGDALWNINFAGQSGELVTDGTIIKAPSTSEDLWHNIISPSQYWTPSDPLVISDASGLNYINLTWTGPSDGHHGQNTDPEDALFVGYFGVGNYDNTLVFSGLDKSSAYDIYVYHTWGWTEDEVTYTITEGSVDEDEKTLEPNQDNVTSGTYADIKEGENYVIFSDISPTRDSEIRLRAESEDGGFVGLQIVQKAGQANAPAYEVLSREPAKDSYTYEDDPKIEAILGDWGMLISEEDVHLSLNGVEVSAEIKKETAETTVSYAAMDLLPGEYEVTVAVDGSDITNNWTFEVRVPPAGYVDALYNVNFAGLAEDDPNLGMVSDGSIVVAPKVGSNYWNNLVAERESKTGEDSVLETNTFTDVIDANGNDPITVEVRGFANWGYATGNNVSVELFQGYAGANAYCDFDTEISGLNADEVYDLYLYTTWTHTEETAVYSLVEGSAARTNDVLKSVRANIASDGATDYSDVEIDENYIVFTEISPTEDGRIVFHVTGEEENPDIVCNGFQLVARGDNPAYKFVSVDPADESYSFDDQPTIEAVLADWRLEIDTSEVQLLLDDAEVNAVVTKNGEETTVKYVSSSLEPGTHTIEIEVNSGESATNWTSSFDVRVAPATYASVLYNVNYAGTSVTNDTFSNVVDGTIIMAPGSGSNAWNNLKAFATNSTPSKTDEVKTNTFAGVTDSSGQNPITVVTRGSASWGLALGAEAQGGPIDLALFQGWAGADAFCDYDTEISGLDTDAVYDLYVYTSWQWTENDAVYTLVEGTADVTTGIVSTVRANVVGKTNYLDLVIEENYFVFTDITPTEAGRIVFHIEGEDGPADIVCNGFQLVARGIDPNPQVESPVVSMSSSVDGELVITWPMSAGVTADTFSVLTNADLTDPTGWAAMDLMPVLDGDIFSSTIMIGEEPSLFIKLESTD